MNQNVVEVIRQKYTELTKKQRLLADYMLADPESMSFITLKELSAETKISEVTILRTCSVLGYSNYNELKYEFRKYLGVRMKTEVQKQNLYEATGAPVYELDDKQQLMMQICQEEQGLFEALFAQIDAGELLHAAEMLLDASNTIICARGASMQPANFLSNRLATMGLPSLVVNTELNDSIQAALPMFSASVLVVPITLPDYYLMTTKVTEFAAQRRCRILCLTDSKSHSPVVPFGDMVLTVPSNTRLFLNSTGPMITLIHLLATAVNIEKSTRKNNRFTTPQEFAKFFRRVED
ncbi:MAG TPA: MurR/RpiR family transcriptional regulator [Eubacteriales bacterium]|nr:MurR/RpiR family transcriptional regulator [Eubacteriales bacterium]